MHAFPDGFLWGAATASFQIEGATTADGRTDSIWDVFCRIPGAVAHGHNGEPAADHYRLMEEDVRLMAKLGLGAYRFSIAWPRIMPDPNTVNRAGLDFYDRLVDSLLAQGIIPWPTLYHWDLPQWLEQSGGWTARDTAHRFSDYVQVVLGRLADRVSHWTTLNEPWCSAFVGYAEGRHAPGRTDPRAAVAAVHHLLLAHGLGINVIRTMAPEVKAGLTLNLFPVRPVDPNREADVEAARRIDGLQNRIFLDPVLAGGYPADVVTDLAPYGLAEHILPGDEAIIGARLDMLGVNYYRDYQVTGDGRAADGPSAWVGANGIGFPARDLPQTDSGWEIVPEGLTTLLVRLHHDYPAIPLYVTENGAAFPDVPDGSGVVNDHDRVEFLAGHLRSAHAALQQGVDLRGYFYWSLLDNFEWAEGYTKRFGLIHVDYPTQRRTPKLSAGWYARVATENRLPVE